MDNIACSRRILGLVGRSVRHIAPLETPSTGWDPARRAADWAIWASGCSAAISVGFTAAHEDALGYAGYRLHDAVLVSVLRAVRAGRALAPTVAHLQASLLDLLDRMIACEA